MLGQVGSLCSHVVGALQLLQVHQLPPRHEAGVGGVALHGGVRTVVLLLLVHQRHVDHVGVPLASQLSLGSVAAVNVVVVPAPRA
eukprot:13603098-Alexandrium_andersonii.AAC.1